MPNSTLLHIPHAATIIPSEWRTLFFLDDHELEAELIRMTDRFTDDLFDLPDSDRLVFPVSRLLVDPERFPDDAQEPMASRGMGAVYTKTAAGQPLKSDHERPELMERYYAPHHQALTNWTRDVLAQHGRCLIIDCHSFPSVPHRCDMDQSIPRPDFCLGTTEPHTPSRLVDAARSALTSLGYSVEIDRPYAGTIVPLEFFQTEPRVSSIMVEVSRKLYINESTGERSNRYDETNRALRSCLTALRDAWSTP